MEFLRPWRAVQQPAIEHHLQEPQSDGSMEDLRALLAGGVLVRGCPLRWQLQLTLVLLVLRDMEVFCATAAQQHVQHTGWGQQKHTSKVMERPGASRCWCPMPRRANQRAVGALTRNDLGRVSRFCTASTGGQHVVS